MADTLYTSQTPVVQNDFDGASHAWGLKYTVSSDCSLTGGRAWVPAAGRPTTFKWQVWRMSDSAKIAETDLNGAGHGSPSSGGWMSFDSSLFSTPGDVAQDNAETYIVCVAFQGGNGAYTDDGSESFPLSSGGLASASTGRFTNAGGTNVMPGTDYAAYFWADVSVETAGTEYTKSLAGTITPNGALTRSTSRALAGTTTPTGTLAKQTSRTFAGTLTPTGSLIRQTAKALAGAITPLGAITSRALARTFTGTINPTGRALKLLSRLLGGSVAPQGSIASEFVEPGIPTTWRAGRPEAKWSAGPPESKWSAGPPERG